MSKERNKLNQDAYDLIARIYAGDRPAEDDPIMRKQCREIFTSALKGKDVVEIGCGPGVDSSFLRASGLNVTATDFIHSYTSYQDQLSTIDFKKQIEVTVGKDVNWNQKLPEKVLKKLEMGYFVKIPKTSRKDKK